MKWIRLRRSKIKVFGKRGKTLPKGFQEEHTAFLHSLLTNDIKGMKPFTLSYNLWLRQNGSPIQDFFVYKTEDSYILDTEGDAKNMIQEFEKLKLSLRVYFEDITKDHLFVFGEGCENFVQSVFGQVPEEGRFFEKGGVFVANNPMRIKEKGFDIFGDVALVPEGEEVSEEDFEDLRIERAIPRIGKELREGFSPLEAGLLHSAISLTKGCYVGQEVIARIHYKGRLPRTLALFEVQNVEESERLMDEDKEVGLITSLSRKGLALGYILSSRAEKGKEYRTEKGFARLL
ncbi:CAF17-like 4Fe-4S cluster assembly/insertion protein YgfZ [Thermocrinis sp.]